MKISDVLRVWTRRYEQVVPEQIPAFSHFKVTAYAEMLAASKVRIAAR